jgi:hypothetical protein
VKPNGSLNDPTEQNEFGLNYLTGQGGLRQDAAQAVQWFRWAADQGLATAQYNLGSMYYEGQGLPRDYAQAAQWYRKAADQGLATAQYNLGVMYENGIDIPQDYAQAAQWYRKAADQGYANAQYNLGVMYFNGQGLPRDYAQAMTWYILAKARDSTLPDKNLHQLETVATPTQIADAQRMAREWWSAHHPG